MAYAPNVRLQTKQDTFDGQGLLSESNIYNMDWGGKPAMLSSTVTWLLGKNSALYPILSMTEGNVANPDATDANEALSMGANKYYKEIEADQYMYPVINRLDKTSKILTTSYTSSDTPGIGYSIFTVVFEDNWLKQHYIIESPQRVRARIVDAPVQSNGGWIYKLQLDTIDPLAFCDFTQLTSGTQWIAMNTANALSESTGTETQRVMPGMIKNQLGVLRMSHSWAGNVANMALGFQIKVGDSTKDMVMPYEIFAFERKCAMEREAAIWYSRYNRNSEGTVTLKDPLTGKPIPQGDGILAQIPNYYSYSKLTYGFLQDIIRTSLFGQSDTDDMTISLHTGTGGNQEFHQAMLTAGATYAINGIFGGTVAANVEDTFIQRTGQGLALKGFFDAFYHIDGYYVKVKRNKFFDLGKRAMNSPLHPQTGLPLESYRMVFLDDSDVDGEPNIQYVAQKGRAFLHGVEKGITPIPDQYKGLAGVSAKEAIGILSNSKDQSSYHRLYTFGVQIKRATRCVHLECNAGQA